MNSTHFLVQFRQLNKLYECMLKEICRRHKLTLIETTIISFLYNNPGRDTAAAFQGKCLSGCRTADSKIFTETDSG